MTTGIVLEGSIGAGKTTILARLYSTLAPTRSLVLTDHFTERILEDRRINDEFDSPE